MRKIEFEPPIVGKISGKTIRSKYTKDGSFPKRGRVLPVPRTVGAMKELLAQLPDKLPIGKRRPVWFNVGSFDEHLSFEEPW